MINYKRKFVENLRKNGDYWLNFQDEGKEKVLDGALFSTCTLIDGCSGRNDFHALYFIDGLAGEELNCGVELHEMLDTTGENILIDDLKSIRDHWLNVPDISIKEALEGMLKSFCEYFAGKSELNNNTVIEVVEYIDETKFVEWNCQNLHEIYSKLDKCYENQEKDNKNFEEER